MGEVLVVGWDDETQQEKGDHVEESNTPKDLFGGFGKGLAWIGGFGCCESNKFGSAEGERGSHEDRTPAFETVAERSTVKLFVVPVFGSEVASVVSRYL